MRAAVATGRLGSLLAPGGSGVQLAARAAASGAPQLMKASVEGYGEGATTLVSKERFRFLVDEPPKLGGKGIGPNPLTVLLGSLVGCTQYTASMIAKEMKLGDIGSVAWAAEGEYDLRGVRGADGDARFRRVSVRGTFDNSISQEDLDRIAEQVDRRCIVAATLKASGLEMQLSLQKGEVDHKCEPACALHDLAAAAQGGGGTTGTTKGASAGREADAPQAAGGAARPAGRRGFATLPSCLAPVRCVATSACRAKDGEDVAREHLKGTEETPQLRKETSQQGASTTAGGAYASRDDPEAQAAQPTAGKSEKQIVEEQGAGAFIHPRESGNAEGGETMTPAHSPGYAGDEAAAAAAAAQEAEEEREDEAEEEELGRELDAPDFEPWKE